MLISVVTPSNTLLLKNESQIIRLHSPIALLEVQIDKNTICNIIIDKQTIFCSAGINLYPINLSININKVIRIKSNDKQINLQFESESSTKIDEKNLTNLIHFCNNVRSLPSFTDNKIIVNDLFNAINVEQLTLLSIQKPLTGYDNHSLINKLQNALNQKVRAICSNPKQGTKIEEIVQDVSLVKRINTDTLSYLSSHTEHWKTRTLNGLIPRRLKADIIEDELNIYENLFFRMAINDIAFYTTKQIKTLNKAKQANTSAIDWEVYGEKINDFKRSILIQKLLLGQDTKTLELENITFDNALDQWLQINKSLFTILNSAFYRQIDAQRRIGKTIHLTNILKNDQRYKALYDVWCLVQKAQQQEQIEQPGAKNDLASNLENYYVVYSSIALLYSMYLLGICFDDKSIFSLTESGEINISASASDKCFMYSIDTKCKHFGQQVLRIKITEKVDIAFSIPQECTLQEKLFNGLDEIISFSETDRMIHIHKKINFKDCDKLRDIIRRPQSQVLKMSHSEQTSYKKSLKSWDKFIDNLKSNKYLHNPKSINLSVIPILYNILPDVPTIERFSNTIIGEQDNKICYLLPIDFDKFESIDKKNLLRRLLNYGESFYGDDKKAWKNYHRAILPVTQTDIGSIQRLMKFISIHRTKLLMEIESDMPIHCPMCHELIIKKLDNNSWKCGNPECGIEWGQTRCTKGCQEYFYWIRPDCILYQDDFSDANECKSILKKEIMFDKYIITDFEFVETKDGKLTPFPVCPKCGVRRFS